MKLCPKCGRSRWPFVMVFAIAVFIAGMTWLMLGLATMDAWMRVLVAVGVFLGVGATLLHYVVSCLRRHCRHGHESPAAAKPALGG
ncbi:hypothetical protein G3480_12700 [Thiorhodococcus mannitoliphagus]|uniref:Uncharacterized protein n=1 Tax=Thiorhodococcus mannitoliphagus TaxID=329406 RepID=A0A6P1DYD6_9GAMM|nr:hypothetical protein [Thiorhodococcus mannitoliphagus]NEX21162.1 hypothetical protein [Thiorhodococcus mannitoliphagus]